MVGQNFADQYTIKVWGYFKLMGPQCGWLLIIIIIIIYETIITYPIQLKGTCLGKFHKNKINNIDKIPNSI